MKCWAMITALVAGGACGLSSEGLLRSEGSRDGGEQRSTQAAQDGTEGPLKECYESSMEPTFNRTRYPYCEVLEPGVLVLYWDHDGAEGKPATKLSFGVAARTDKDYVALGFSQESQGMRGIDVAMLRKNQEGNWKLEDRWALDYVTPELDQNQNKLLEFLEVDDDDIRFGFSMPVQHMDVVECKPDPEDAILDPERWVFVMYAMGKNEGDDPAYHGEENGMFKLPLFATQKAFSQEAGEMKLPSESTTVQIRIPPFEMPASSDTTYMCMYWPTPQDAKYHVYHSKILGSPSYVKNYVHHMFLYQLFVDNASYPMGQPFRCEQDSPSGHGIPLIMSSHEALTSPSDTTWEEVDAAFPLGKGYAKYWMLEVHLNNPDLAAGVIDSPGFEVTFSPKLRKHDAGLFLTGSVPNNPRLSTSTNLVIPPHQESFDFLNYCPSVCTQNLIPQQGVNIIYSRVHMHMLGSKGEIQLIRGGNNGTSAAGTRKRLTYLEHWDFDHQEGTSYEAPGVPLYPTDRVITRCTFNSTDRTNTTYWGDSAHDEMCIGYLFIYPVPESAVCLDLRGAHDPTLDAFRRMGTPLNITFCTTLSQYSAATSEPDAHGYAQYVAAHGLALNIPKDELDVKFNYTGEGYFRSTCPAFGSSESGVTAVNRTRIVNAAGYGARRRALRAW